MEILQQGQASNDTTCYQDKLTGNSYRIKVDKNTGGNPSLFEVGGFRDYLIGGTSTEEDEDEAVWRQARETYHNKIEMEKRNKIK